MKSKAANCQPRSRTSRAIPPRRHRDETCRNSRGKAIEGHADQRYPEKQRSDRRRPRIIERKSGDRTIDIDAEERHCLGTAEGRRNGKGAAGQHEDKEEGRDDRRTHDRKRDLISGRKGAGSVQIGCLLHRRVHALHVQGTAGGIWRSPSFPSNTPRIILKGWLLSLNQYYRLPVRNRRVWKPPSASSIHVVAREYGDEDNVRLLAFFPPGRPLRPRIFA